MRITAVNFNNVYYNTRLNRKDKPNNTYPAKLSQPLKTDTVSFKSTAPYAEALRALLPFKIPDIYSPIILLDPATLNKLSDSHVFSSTIGNITRAIRPLTSSLFPVEYDFYNLVREGAKRTPNKTLRKFISEQYPTHNKILIPQQLKIFDKLKDAASDFPANLFEEFNYLMYISEQKIHNSPVFIPFSNKEFKYKLNNIRKRIMTSPTDEEVKAINKLTGIANSIPTVSREDRQAKGFDVLTYEAQQKKMIDEFLNVLTRSVLAGDEDLVNLALLAEQRIYNVPSHIRFNRKSFIVDLQRITSRVPDKKLARQVDKIAISLPTSKQSLSAFIVKADGRSAEQTGYDMLSGSLGTIDHLVASHNGGADALSNYVLASSYMNSMKAHKTFAEVYKHDPHIAEYAQAQIDRLIELAKYTKIIKKSSLGDGYIFGLARKLERLSKDPTLKFDIDELKCK